MNASTTASETPARSAKLLPADWITAAILGVVSLTLAIRGLAGVDLGAATAFHTALLAVFVGLACLMARYHGCAWVTWSRPLAIVAVMFVLYSTLAHLAFEAIPWRADPVLDRMDRFLLLGWCPSLALEPASTYGWIESMAALYGCFIPYLYLSIAIGCLGRPDHERDHFVTGFALLYAVSFLGYLFMPARGPVVHLAAEYQGPLQGGPFLKVVVDSVDRLGGPHGAMPSLHIGMSVYACCFDLRYHRLRGWTYLPVVALIYVATVILRYHYVVDLVAGTIIAVGAVRGSAALLRPQYPRNTALLLRFPWQSNLAWIRQAVLAAMAPPGAVDSHWSSPRDRSIQRWTAGLLATGGREPPALGSGEEVGSAGLPPLHRGAVERLEARLVNYRQELGRLGVSQQEVFLPLSYPRAALFILRELELVVVGIPVAAWGALSHCLPWVLLRRLVRRRVGSGAKLASAMRVVWPLLAAYYVLLLTMAASILPVAGTVVFGLCLPISGCSWLLLRQRTGRVVQRVRTFVLFLRDPDTQRRLIQEGRALITEILAQARGRDDLEETLPQQQ